MCRIKKICVGCEQTYEVKNTPKKCVNCGDENLIPLDLYDKQIRSKLDKVDDGFGAYEFDCLFI